MDKKQLYNQIMEKVAIEVKKALNESDIADWDVSNVKSDWSDMFNYNSKTPIETWDLSGGVYTLKGCVKGSALLENPDGDLELWDKNGKHILNKNGKVIKTIPYEKMPSKFDKIISKVKKYLSKNK